MPHPNRRTTRLPQFDYGASGAYFITVCAHDRRPIFGHIRHGIVCLSPLGALVWREWRRSFELRPECSAGAFIVMPNHWHGLVHFHPSESGHPTAARVEAFGRPTSGTLAALVRGLKSGITSSAVKELGWADGPVCQARYWDHVVRHESDYQRIDAYIRSNPARWPDDCFHP